MEKCENQVLCSFHGSALLSKASDEDLRARRKILQLARDSRVITEREAKVRLENEFFPWVVGRVLNSLDGNELKRYGYAGRRRLGKSETTVFYTMSGTPYSEIVNLIQLKRRISGDVLSIMTGDARPGYHAEDLFIEAFEKLGFKNHGRDVSEFRGRRVQSIEGKEPANLDFVVERDGIVYGVDVKNWLKYERETIWKVEKKVRLAVDLCIVPFIVARYVDRDTIYTRVIRKGGIVYPYVDLLVPPTFRSLADDARRYLGYPILAVDVLPEYKVEWLEKLHLGLVSRRKSVI
jgi:hypothetical protein